MIDVHVHLDQYPDLEEVLRRMESQGVSALTNSVNYESTLKNLSISSHPSVFLAVGVHPFYSSMEEVEKIEKFVNEAFALGEIGLDKTYEISFDLQERVFIAQLELAQKNDKPVIVHSRGSAAEVLSILEDFSVEVVLHWFSGRKKYVEEAIERDYYFSIGPSISYSQTTQFIAEHVPRNRLLLESDGPVRYKGKRAEPISILNVAEVLARIRGIAKKDLLRICEKNARKLFSI